MNSNGGVGNWNLSFQQNKQLRGVAKVRQCMSYKWVEFGIWHYNSLEDVAFSMTPDMSKSWRTFCSSVNHIYCRSSCEKCNIDHRSSSIEFAILCYKLYTALLWVVSDASQIVGLKLCQLLYIYTYMYTKTRVWVWSGRQLRVLDWCDNERTASV
jgi:hypothetical protein